MDLHRGYEMGLGRQDFRVQALLEEKVLVRAEWAGSFG